MAICSRCGVVPPRKELGVEYCPLCGKVIGTCGHPAEAA